MPTQRTETNAMQPTYKALSDALAACQTVAELFKLATSAAFGEASHSLPGPELDALRDDYKARQISLDGRVRLDVFNGRIARIVGCEWWHSDTYDQGATGGDGVTLFLRPEDEFQHDGVVYVPTRRYKASTSSAPIVRFCTRFANVLPTEDAPARAQLEQVPVSDPTRAAQGQKRWNIKALPMPTRGGSSPF